MRTVRTVAAPAAMAAVRTPAAVPGMVTAVAVSIANAIAIVEFAILHHVPAAMEAVGAWAGMVDGVGAAMWTVIVPTDEMHVLRVAGNLMVHDRRPRSCRVGDGNAPIQRMRAPT